MLRPADRNQHRTEDETHTPSALRHHRSPVELVLLEALRIPFAAEYAARRRRTGRPFRRWPEAKLDAIQLPHPLLGNLTVREMLFFTLFHQSHHMDVIRRRLTAATGIARG
jgi:hypothetical protein